MPYKNYDGQNWPKIEILMILKFIFWSKLWFKIKNLISRNRSLVKKLVGQKLESQ